MKTVNCGNYSRKLSSTGLIQSRTLGVVLAGMMMAGCSMTNTLSPKVTSADQAVTNSVVAQTKPEGVAGNDAEVIKTAVASAPVSANIKPLAWRNPETGSSGTIMAIDKFMGKHGQSCRGFKTSVDTFMGIALYNGETCQVSPGEWVLSWFKPSE